MIPLTHNEVRCTEDNPNRTRRTEFGNEGWIEVRYSGGEVDEVVMRVGKFLFHMEVLSETGIWFACSHEDWDDREAFCIYPVKGKAHIKIGGESA